MNRIVMQTLGIFIVAITLGALPQVEAQKKDESGPVIILFDKAPSSEDWDALVSMKVGVRKSFSIIPAVAATMRYDDVKYLEGFKNIRMVEPDYRLYRDAIPNDPRFDEMWGLDNTGQVGGTPGADISAVAAWDVTTGSSSILVAVLDTGTQVTHPDLAGNIWVNPGEIAGNGIDDDGNGFIDDINGWDFFNNDNSVFDSATNDDHGTHVSGTIGAVGNNGVGVTGVNWDVSIMSLKFLGPQGGSTSDAIAGIQYAANKGVRVINASWGGGGFSQALKDAIDNCNCLFVAAAGNAGTNNDASPHFPSSYTSSNLIAVAATDRNDQVANFSNFGATSVDLGAPGVTILSTLPTNTYGNFSGTSMATPHVTGVAALVLANSPDLSPTVLKSQILDSADPIASLSGITLTGARLNAAAALGSTPPPPPPSNCPNGSIDFNSFATESYSNQDASGNVTVEDGGDTLRLAANTWRRSTQSFNVTPNTVIEFDFQSGSQGEIHGIGFDEDQTLTNNTRIFQFWGTQNWGGAFQFSPRYNGSGNFQSVTVPVGQSYTGSSMRLVFVNDKDAGALNNEGRFRCVRVFEDAGGGGQPTVVYSENFDDGSAQGWAKTSGATDLWRVASNCVAAASGSSTVSFSRTPQCDYDVGTAIGTATGPVINTSGFSTVTLEFNHTWQTESFAGGGFDEMFIEVSSNGGTTWTTIQTIDSSDANPSGYVAASFNVAPSSQFQFRFRFDSGDGSFNDFLGWYIDDVVVTGQ